MVFVWTTSPVWRGFSAGSLLGGRSDPLHRSHRLSQSGSLAIRLTTGVPVGQWPFPRLNTHGLIVPNLVFLMVPAATRSMSA
jgi:hypothetical protein